MKLVELYGDRIPCLKSTFAFFLFFSGTMSAALFQLQLNLPLITVCRVVEHCIKKRLQWNTCFARKICKESEYYEDMMRYLRKNLAVSLIFGSILGCFVDYFMLLLHSNTLHQQASWSLQRLLSSSSFPTPCFS